MLLFVCPTAQWSASGNLIPRRPLTAISKRWSGNTPDQCPVGQAFLGLDQLLIEFRHNTGVTAGFGLAVHRDGTAASRRESIDGDHTGLARDGTPSAGVAHACVLEIRPFTLRAIGPERWNIEPVSLDGYRFRENRFRCPRLDCRREEAQQRNGYGRNQRGGDGVGGLAHSFGPGPRSCRRRREGFPLCRGSWRPGFAQSRKKHLVLN